MIYASYIYLLDDFLTALQNITPTGGLVREGTFLYFRDIQVGDFYKYLESSPEAFFLRCKIPTKNKLPVWKKQILTPSRNISEGPYLTP